MSAASNLAYQLRPNKAVDRELFLLLLARFSGSLELENYTYIGLGGPFLEDFRLVHSRLGITGMVCIEAEEAVHKRQLFNRPVPSIDCQHSTLEEYLDATDFDRPVIIWFDYTDPKELTKQISKFAETVKRAPDYSVLRITLNANPGSLGQPDPKEFQVPLNGKKNENDSRPTLGEWRLHRFRERVGAMFPSETKPDDMDRVAYGKSILKALKLSVSNELLSPPERSVSWLLATQYADGQLMVTATLLVHPPDSPLGGIAEKWSFHSTPDKPLVLDMPMVSTRERLTLESVGGKSPDMTFDFPESNLGEDPVVSFTRFARVFPHFSKVDL